MLAAPLVLGKCKKTLCPISAEYRSLQVNYLYNHRDKANAVVHNRLLRSHICRGLCQNAWFRYTTRLVSLERHFRRIDCSALVASDVLLVNQTPNTLQNLCLDFATLGDLKIVERPSVYTIAPHGFQSIKATIKVSSTETGVIFGSILWEGPNMSEACVILNDIHIDIMDYIKPAYCNEAQVGHHYLHSRLRRLVTV